MIIGMRVSDAIAIVTAIVITMTAALMLNHGVPIVAVPLIVFLIAWLYSLVMLRSHQ